MSITDAVTAILKEGAPQEMENQIREHTQLIEKVSQHGVLEVPTNGYTIPLDQRFAMSMTSGEQERENCVSVCRK